MKKFCRKCERCKDFPFVNSTNASTKAQKIVAYELSQLGIGDTKGNNNVKYNTWYYGKAVSGNGYAWCMAFQSYCVDGNWKVVRFTKNSKRTIDNRYVYGYGVPNY